ncbi:hypothetical protein CBI55_03350 [Pseudomonas syringae]|uniref:tetratricopeptide repeat protein n=1 Tax=Pseudomonas syringae TaxID=317 RepID=UPI000C1C9464|nr:hypothetical protein [Pseudomonas syringae]PIO95971.1 hypothetical protein CBI55_03350 [Pseudomonas syringae]
MAVAKTIADTILEELNHFSTTDKRPDSFTSARLKREIRKLENIDYTAKILCDAILATIEGRQKEALDNFSEILKYDPDNSSMHQNFAYSLAKFGMISEAHQHYLAAVDNSPNTNKLLMDLAESSLVIHRPGDFASAFKRNSEKVNTRELMQVRVISRALKLAALFADEEISDDDSHNMYKTAKEFRDEFKVKVINGYYRNTGMYDGPKVTFYATIEGDWEQVMDANMRLADRVIDKDQGHLLKEVTHIFVPMNAEDAEWMSSTDKQSVSNAGH